jgi:hypothetical protein
VPAHLLQLEDRCAGFGGRRDKSRPQALPGKGGRIEAGQRSMALDDRCGGMPGNRLSLHPAVLGDLAEDKSLGDARRRQPCLDELDGLDPAAAWHGDLLPSALLVSFAAPDHDPEAVGRFDQVGNRQRDQLRTAGRHCEAKRQQRRIPLAA